MQGKCLLKVLAIIGLFLSVAWAAEGNDPDTVIMPHYASSMHFWEDQQQASDSITHNWWGEKRYFNRDSLFARCARLGIDSVREQMNFYYSDILDVIRNPEKRRAEARKMREAIKRYGSDKLKVELDFCEATVMPDSTEALFDIKIKHFYELSVKYATLGDIQHELEALRYAFVKSFNYQNYEKAFHYAVRLEERLDAVTDADYSGYHADWFELGNAYCEFGDYEHAIPLLKKALRDEPVPYFSDRYNLRARNTLGVYYRDQGDLDLSDYGSLLCRYG